MPVDPIYENIGALIKVKRNKLGQTQKELAGALSISRGSLANIEIGKQSILVHQLYNFAEALKLAPTDLLPSRSTKEATAARNDPVLPTKSWRDDLNATERQQVAKFYTREPILPKPEIKLPHAKTRKNR